MKKRLLSTLIMLVMVLSLVACGGDDTTDENDTSEAVTEGDTTDTDTDDEDGDTAASGDAIHIVNGKIEIDEAFKAFAKSYEEETGQEVIIESLGGGVDINGTLKGYHAAGNMPDIFVIGGQGDYSGWSDYVVDLSDEPWVEDTDYAFMDGDKVVGFPYAVEGYGITYNKDILEAADVDPDTLINFEGWKTAFETIDAKKDELGLTAVASVAAEPSQMYWSTGNHIFGAYLSQGLERNDTTYIDMLNNGEIDKDRMTQFAKFVDMLFDYADQNVLISGTYDDQMSLWASGKAAFVIQGNWIDPELPGYGVEFDCGIAPLAFLEEDTPGILADSPSWWVVHNEGNVEASKEFLNALVTSEAGQEFMVTEAGMISPYKSVDIAPETPLAKDLKTYVDSGESYSWEWTKMPENIAMNATGSVFELLAKDEIDTEQFVSLMETEIAKYVESMQ